MVRFAWNEGEDCPSCGGTGWVGHANDPDGWCARCAGGSAEAAPERHTCEDCDAVEKVADHRGLYDPTKGPLWLCGNCAESRWQEEMDRLTEEGPPQPPPLRSTDT